MWVFLSSESTFGANGTNRRYAIPNRGQNKSLSGAGPYQAEYKSAVLLRLPRVPVRKCVGGVAWQSVSIRPALIFPEQLLNSPHYVHVAFS